MGSKILVVFCALCVLVVFCAPSIKPCPPGGKYFDKHLGQNGRWRCCNEICEAMIYQSMCNKRCPGYEQLKASGSRIMKTTDSTPTPTPADTTEDPTVGQPDPKPPERSSSDSDPAGAADQPNPMAGGTSDVIVVYVLGTGVVILLIPLSVFIVLFVRKRGQQKRRGRGQGSGQGIPMNTFYGRPPTEDPEVRHTLLHGARPEDPAAEAVGGPGAGESCLSEGHPPIINPDADQHGQRLGSSFIQTAKEEGRPMQVTDESSGYGLN